MNRNASLLARIRSLWETLTSESSRGPGPVLIRTCLAWWDDKAPRLAAALAYFSSFSIAPILVIAAGVSGFVFGEEAARGHLKEELVAYTNPRTAETLESMIRGFDAGRDNVWASLLGGVVLLVAAGGVFGQLKDALDTIWKTKSRPGGGVMKFFKDRFLSFAMVLGIGFLLLISLVVSVTASILIRRMEAWLPMTATLWGILNLVLSLGIEAVVFAMIFKFFPDARPGWRSVWIGAGATALLFHVGKYGLGLYLGRDATMSAYGAAGAGIVLLLWVYYASLILLWGAELTRIHDMNVKAPPAAAPTHRHRRPGRPSRAR